jgi:hypothetical protein
MPILGDRPHEGHAVVARGGLVAPLVGRVALKTHEYVQHGVGRRRHRAPPKVHQQGAAPVVLIQGGHDVGEADVLWPKP